MCVCVCACVSCYCVGDAARTDLEREVAELRAQLCKASILGEVDELKKALELKERERLQLFVQVEVGAH